MDLAAIRREGRGEGGRFGPGNLAAFRHGLRIQSEPPALAVEHRELVEAIAADLGGMSQLSVVQVALVRELARLQIVADSLGSDLLANAPRTGKGNARSTTNLWLKVTDRLERLSMRVGLTRAPRMGGIARIVQDVRSGDE